MQKEGIAAVEIDLSVTVTGDIPETGGACRFGIQLCQRHDRKTLCQSPEIGNTLKNREVDQVLLLNFVLNLPQLSDRFVVQQQDRFADNQMCQNFAVGAVDEIDIAQIKKCQQRVEMVDAVMKILQRVVFIDVAVEFMKLFDQRRIFRFEAQRFFGILFGKEFKDRRDQYGVGSGDKTPRFDQNIGFFDIFCPCDSLQDKRRVAGILFERIGHFRIGFVLGIFNPQPAAEVDGLQA